MATRENPEGIAALLREAAEAELGDTSLDHPARPEVPAPEPHPTRRRGPAILAVAASVVLAAVVIGFVVGRDDPVRVHTPADVPPETGSSVLPGDAQKIVSDAVEATLATSWVAKFMDRRDSGNWDVTVIYHPPVPEDGRSYAGLEVRFDGRDVGAVIGPSRSPRILQRCEPHQGAPCRPSGWVDHSDGMARVGQGPDETRAAYEAELTALPTVQAASPSGATLGPGEYEVRARNGLCTDGCEGVAEIRDGLVVRLELTSGAERFVWEYGSFGDAPPIDEPSPNDIVELGTGPGNTVCAVTIEVTPGSDPAVVDTAVRKWLSDNGRDSSMRLNDYAYSLDGVTNVVFSQDEGCEQNPVIVEVRTR